MSKCDGPENCSFPPYTRTRSANSISLITAWMAHDVEICNLDHVYIDCEERRVQKDVLFKKNINNACNIFYGMDKESNWFYIYRHILSAIEVYTKSPTLFKDAAKGKIGSHISVGLKTRNGRSYLNVHDTEYTLKTWCHTFITVSKIRNNCIVDNNNQLIPEDSKSIVTPEMSEVWNMILCHLPIPGAGSASTSKRDLVVSSNNVQKNDRIAVSVTPSECCNDIRAMFETSSFLHELSKPDMVIIAKIKYVPEKDSIGYGQQLIDLFSKEKNVKSIILLSDHEKKSSVLLFNFRDKNIITGGGKQYYFHNHKRYLVREGKRGGKYIITKGKHMYLTSLK